MTLYAIQSTYTVHTGTYEATLEYADTEADALQRLFDWAAFHNSLNNLSHDGRTFHKTDMGGNTTTWRIEEITLPHPAPETM